MSFKHVSARCSRVRMSAGSISSTRKLHRPTCKLVITFTAITKLFTIIAVFKLYLAKPRGVRTRRRVCGDQLQTYK